MILVIQLYLFQLNNMVGPGPFNYEFSLYSGPNLLETQTTTNDSITFNNNVSSGSYSVTILETNTGCLITDFVSYNLNPVMVTANVGQLTAPGVTDGSLFLSVDSGLAPFTYIWEVTSTGVTDTSTILMEFLQSLIYLLIPIA